MRLSNVTNITATNSVSMGLQAFTIQNIGAIGRGNGSCIYFKIYNYGLVLQHFEIDEISYENVVRSILVL